MRNWSPPFQNTVPSRREPRASTFSLNQSKKYLFSSSLRSSESLAVDDAGQVRPLDVERPGREHAERWRGRTAAASCRARANATQPWNSLPSSATTSLASLTKMRIAETAAEQQRTDGDGADDRSTGSPARPAAPRPPRDSRAVRRRDGRGHARVIVMRGMSIVRTVHDPARAPPDAWPRAGRHAARHGRARRVHPSAACRGKS